MKIKIFNWLIIIDILTVLLILAISFIPSSPARIVLGLPFLLFFPGYTLVEALFARRSVPRFFKRDNQNDSAGDNNAAGMDGIERVALGFGMSIAVTALIGLGLNYTSWGIRLEPVLYSISAFIIILSAVALFRKGLLNNQNLIWSEYHLKLPGWEGSTFNKTLTVILAVAIVGAIGTLIYTVAFPKVGERFTEFYILGLQNVAADYPSEFTLQGSRVVAVKYGDDVSAVASTDGRVILGVVNHEQQTTSYTVALQIDGQTASISYAGQNLERLSIGPLDNEGKWEGQIGFAPSHTGDNQKVEFFLYKDGASDPEETLHLWVNVKAK